eukprot:Skav205800  [mRNA]  locus=scaffold307:159248:160386:- [translate_table: standard]
MDPGPDWSRRPLVPAPGRWRLPGLLSRETDNGQPPVVWVFDLPEPEPPLPQPEESPMGWKDVAVETEDDEEVRWKTLQSLMKQLGRSGSEQKRGRPEKVEELLVKIPELMDSRNPMHVASKSGNLPMVTYLMKGWASLATTEESRDLHQPSSHLL